MASLLSRFTTFLPNTTIRSNDHNQEFNRIVNLLNGTTTNLKTVLKTSDAGDPPLELDQLSSGPIQEWYQGGILKASITNDGSLSTTGNIALNNANPSITFDDTSGTDAKIDHDASVLRLGSTSVNHISLDVSTGVATFAQIPVLPASDPTSDNQAARKLYVDTRRTRWAASFYIADVAARGVDADFSNVQGAWIPGSNFTATHIAAKFGAGSASGSFTLTLRKQPAGSQAQTDLGTITFNSGTLGVEVETDIADHTFTANDWVYAIITAASSPLQKSVWVAVRGYQTPQNP